MADMLVRDLAAFEVDTTPGSSSGVPAPNIELAVARAEGALIGLDDGSPLAAEFVRLLEAVRNATVSQNAQHRAS
jgi:hypothetical protein